MTQKINFYIRAVLTGIWFFFSIFVGLCILIVRWKDPSVGATVSRIVSWGACKILGYRIRVENVSKLYAHQPCVYIGNHQSTMDMFTMGSMFPFRTVVIGKREVKWIPLFGLFFAGTGMVMIDRRDRTQAVAGLKATTDAMLEKGHSIWIFAEGSRSLGRGLLPFKKGAFHMAIAAQVPIVPVVQQYLHTYLDVEAQRITPGDILIRVLDPIPTKGMTPEDLPRLMAEVRRCMINELCRPEMKYPPALVDLMKQETQ